MKSKLISAVVASLFAFASAAALGHDEAQQKKEKLGKVLFKTSCTPEAQKEFERALGMLHSFWFPETIKAFTAIPQTDPGCAIAYWGLAVREFYKDFDKVDQDTRTGNYANAMEALAKKYPNDVEAKIFHALALNEIFDHKSMEPLLKAISILEPLDKKYPAHPGITHYLIHSYDFAPIAAKGVPAANKYAKIAPAAPHAVHMPSHIYSMVGMWKASIASNLKSNQVSRDFSTQAKLDGVLAGVPHALDFMQYAYLQLGQDSNGKALVDESAQVKKVIGPISAGNT